MTRIPFLSVLMLCACGGSVDAWENPSDRHVERADRALVQVVHLSPDAPAVDVVVNESRRVISGLAYLDATVPARVPAGIYGVDIPASGGLDPVISADLEFDAQAGYTIVAWDALEDIKPAVLGNSIEGLEPGLLRLQLTHTAVGVGTVDVWDLAAGIKIINDFEFGATGVLDVPAGILDVGLDLDEDAVPDVTFTVPELGVDTLVNVFAINDEMGVGLYAVFVDGSTARVDAD
jgi:hypothetical protein